MIDKYLEAICKERSLDQQRRSAHLLPDEAGWALLVDRSWDGPAGRWPVQALLGLGRRVLALGSRRSIGHVRPMGGRR